ncbi:MAG: hypothetical protein HYU99_02445 [Deltaproteobacteria bacterium]|nr:hypothetical protein [Deltaproteobacteria bacterium]
MKANTESLEKTGASQQVETGAKAWRKTYWRRKTATGKPDRQYVSVNGNSIAISNGYGDFFARLIFEADNSRRMNVKNTEIGA